MQKIDLEELDNISGGVRSISGTEAADTVLKENEAAVCGMGSVKALGLGDPAEGIGKKVKAGCPVCGKKTWFYVSSGAQSRCSVCGYVRLDL